MTNTTAAYDTNPDGSIVGAPRVLEGVAAIAATVEAVGTSTRYAREALDALLSDPRWDAMARALREYSDKGSDSRLTAAAAAALLTARSSLMDARNEVFGSEGLLATLGYHCGGDPGALAAGTDAPAELAREAGELILSKDFTIGATLLHTDLRTTHY